MLDGSDESISMCRKIKKVRITPGCISCGSCEAICPRVFEVKDIAIVKGDVDANAYKELVEEAAEMCPVSVIKIEEEPSEKG